MHYLIDIRIDGSKKSTFRVDAKSEAQALERLVPRLPPQHRDSFTVDAVRIDPSSVGNEEPFGVFGGE